MNWRGWIAAAIAFGVSAGCGSSGTASVTTPTSTSAPTTIAPTTSWPTTTTEPTTTTTMVLSREARLAVGRCQDAMGPLFAEIASLSRDRLDAAQAACNEAKLQLEADHPAPGSVALKLRDAILSVAVDVGFAELKMISGEFDAAAQASLQKAVDAFDATVTPLLA